MFGTEPVNWSSQVFSRSNTRIVQYFLALLLTSYIKYFRTFSFLQIVEVIQI